MFDTLSDRLTGVFDRLRGRGALNEADVREAMREVRIALLEADVALPVARQLHRRGHREGDRPAGAALGHAGPAGRQDRQRRAGRRCSAARKPRRSMLEAKPPVVIMMVGLQGSGKTTTTAKLGKLLKEKHGKKAMMASLDVNRPAAQEQLAVLGEQVERRDAADRRRPAAGRHRPPRARSRPSCRRSTCCCSTPPAGSTSTKR